MSNYINIVKCPYCYYIFSKDEIINKMIVTSFYNKLLCPICGISFLNSNIIQHKYSNECLKCQTYKKIIRFQNFIISFSFIYIGFNLYKKNRYKMK